MAGVITFGKCRNCRWDLAPGDLFCANCGVEAPPSGTPPPGEALARRPYARVECPACGASMAYDAALQAVACPFCGAVQLRAAAEVAARAEPSAALPFQISGEAALAAFARFARSSFWYPGDLLRRGQVHDLRAVFVPAWCFRGQVTTFWTADTSDGARHTWRPIAGSRDKQFTDLVVLASVALTPGELAALGPFPLAARTPLAELAPSGDEVIETPRLSQHAALVGLPASLHAWESAELARELPGRTRKVHCDQLITDVAGELVLVPVWIAAYRYGDKRYRFLVNGGTGQATGTAPTSWVKVLGVATLILIALILLVLVAALLTAGGGQSKLNQPSAGQPGQYAATPGWSTRGRDWVAMRTAPVRWGPLVPSDAPPKERRPGTLAGGGRR